MEIYGINQESLVVSRGLRAMKKLKGMLIPATIYGVIYLLFVILIEVIIGVKVPFVILMSMLGIYLGFLAIQIIYYTKIYYGLALGGYMVYVVKEANGLKIICKKPRSVTIFGALTGARMMLSDSAVGLIMGGVLYAGSTEALTRHDLPRNLTEAEEALVKEVLRGDRRSEYDVKEYENVTCVGENSKWIYYEGDYVEGQNRKRKKFRLKKIYVNYEKLKEV